MNKEISFASKLSPINRKREISNLFSCGGIMEELKNMLHQVVDLLFANKKPEETKVEETPVENVEEVKETIVEENQEENQEVEEVKEEETGTPVEETLIDKIAELAKKLKARG